LRAGIKGKVKKQSIGVWKMSETPKYFPFRRNGKALD